MNEQSTWWINFDLLCQKDGWAVRTVCTSFSLPAPTLTEGGVEPPDRLKFTAACMTLKESRLNKLMENFCLIDAKLGRRVMEDVLDTSMVIASTEDEIQEHTVRDLSVQTGEKCE